MPVSEFIKAVANRLQIPVFSDQLAKRLLNQAVAGATGADTHKVGVRRGSVRFGIHTMS